MARTNSVKHMETGNFEKLVESGIDVHSGTAGIG